MVHFSTVRTASLGANEPILVEYPTHICQMCSPPVIGWGPRVPSQDGWAELPIRKAESQQHCWFAPRLRRHSAFPPVTSQSIFSGSSGPVTQSPSSPFPLGTTSVSCQSYQLLPHALVTCMGRATGRRNCGPSLWDATAPTQEVMGPSKVISK
jgi:hypothetical protein